MKDLYLSDISPKDKPWDKKRAQTDLIQEIYRNTEFHPKFEQMSGCGQELVFALVADDLGEVSFKLQSARFCRVRHCPQCQWRRSLKLVGRFLKALPNIQGDYPTARFIFLTLTVKNPRTEDLRETLEWMNKAWTRVTQRKQFPALGWIKSVEVTCSKSEPGMSHPHFHVLIMVPAGYFGSAGGYLSQDKWVELWRKSLRVEYQPSVHVRSVKPKKGSEMSAAIVETLKYGVKPEEAINDPLWLLELTRQLHNTRAIAVGGVLRRYLSEEEPQDLININEQEDEAEPVTEEKFKFGWRQQVKRYVYKKPVEQLEQETNS